MKIINQLVIFIIIISIIFIVNNDYKSIYTKSISYLQNKIEETSSIYKNKVADPIKITTDNLSALNKVETPGALVAPREYLTQNTNKISLSSKNIIEITNNERLLNGGLIALKENQKLNLSAEKKLQDMFVKQYFEHVSPSGVGVSDLGEQFGYEYIIIGENLALGNFKDDKALVDAWMASPGHRANILNDKYSEIGVATSSGIYNGNNVWMAVQHFGLPKSACPSIDEILKGVIGLKQDDIEVMEDELATRRENIDSGVVVDGLTLAGQIEKYNLLVSTYNRLISDIKEKINQYNEQVKKFNACLAEIN